MLKATKKGTSAINHTSSQQTEIDSYSGKPRVKQAKMAANKINDTGTESDGSNISGVCKSKHRNTNNVSGLPHKSVKV